MNMRAQRAKAVNTLLTLLLLLMLLFGGLGAAHLFAKPQASLTPMLGLDLEGGQQLILEPAVEGGQVTSGQVDQAVNIIRQRVDGSGVAEAEVTTLGGRNISVAMPGTPDPAVIESLQASSRMTFREVLAVESGAPAPKNPKNLPGYEGSSSKDGKASGKESGKGSTGGSSAPATIAEGVWPAQSSPKATDSSKDSSASSSGKDSGKASDKAAPSASASQGSGDAASSPAPTGSDDAQQPAQGDGTPHGKDITIPAAVQKRFDSYDCGTDKTREEAQSAGDDDFVVACDPTGTEKFLLSPTRIEGSSIADASSGPETNQQGQPTGKIAVSLELDGKAADTFADLSAVMAAQPKDSPYNRFAMLLDGEVISAPGMNQVITNGQASITGDFTAEEGKALADQLKFGALPFSFKLQSSEQISPTLGDEQLRWGIWAGVIGLALVAVYSLFQYRALGLVTLASLALAALLAYLAVVLLGWQYNLRLTMAGITGLIVAIGVTADSFIVYFERVRDEVREGRPLRNAVDTGWARARRTILISDAVNLLAAVILYLLSEANVKAFAFMLGLTTIIDLVVVMLFTHPVVTLLAQTRFFGDGHKLSGMNPESLGARRTTYVGRGRVRSLPDTPPTTGTTTEAAL
ncbi:protein translocase subunit SecD [Kytococcus schroeteri]|uniref:Protein translocase subunit SecD n=1 Tax=Kytococcus schroeteri TaxID=138300 RepID=A0A2I1PDM1_9MICO|nr:protein translocase subunit SecD [Kytococcus schroeteri]PKZ42716.1 protein translocase subunit SecD [Kytococcus schroeteri]